MELLRALGACSEQPAAAIAELLGLPAPSASDHADLFLFQLYPYASVYLGTEGMLGGEAGDRVAGFWRALELVPPAEPDHLAALLGLYAELAGLPGERALRARHALLWEHLLSWLPAWLGRVEELAPAYRDWARLLRDVLLAETVELGPPVSAPLHLRSAPPVAGAGDILAAARSGAIITRADLGRAAVDLGLGLRQGERRYCLAALLAQDAPGVRAWLAGECRRQAVTHRSQADAWLPVSAIWANRAEAAAALLDGRRAALAVVGGAGGSA